MKKTDKWYKEKPEWGTPESTKKAKKTTPGESCKEGIQKTTLTHSGGLKSPKMNVPVYKDSSGKYWVPRVGGKYQRQNKKKISIDGREQSDFVITKSKAKVNSVLTKMNNTFNKAYKKETEITLDEEVAGNSTGAIPNPAQTAQGSKKKNYKVLTRHYIELLGKRKKRIK